MRLLLLLAALGGLAYYWYTKSAAPPPLPPPPAVTKAAPTPKPTPVDFSIKVAVQQLYEYWRLSLTSRQAALSRPIDPAEEFNKIKTVLTDKYRQHTEAALEQNVRQAVADIHRDLPESEQKYIADGILSLRRGRN